MSLLLYVVVLLVSLSSVLFGLGWLSAPEPQYKAPAVQVAHQLAPARKTTAGVVLSPAAPGTPAKPAKAASASPSQGVTGSVATTGADPDGATQRVQAVTTPACDIQACSTAYRSFRASDCTYQPYNGPRRLCTKGTPPSQARAKPTTPAAPSAADAQADAARAQAPACNIAACEAAYKTFDPSDCTYQPYNGPRRLCTK